MRLVARHTACGDGSIAQVDDLRPFPCAGGGVVHVCEPQEGQRPQVRVRVRVGVGVGVRVRVRGIFCVQRCSGAQRVPPAIGVDVLLAAILELQPGRRTPSWSGLGQTVSVQLGELAKPALAAMRKSILEGDEGKTRKRRIILTATSGRFFRVVRQQAADNATCPPRCQGAI